MRNVRRGDQKVRALLSTDAGLLGAHMSGLAGPLGINPYHMAQEGESLRRAFPLRPVREAVDDDFASVGDP